MFESFVTYSIIRDSIGIVLTVDLRCDPKIQLESRVTIRDKSYTNLVCTKTTIFNLA